MMKNAVLIGFMGTGKTSTGRLLASRLGYSFVDTDRKIEKECHLTIKQLFAEHGETYFREQEAAVVRKVARQHHLVISTGGGTILNPDNMKALRKKGVIVSLTASVEVILERTSRKNTRPLLENQTMEERRAAITKLRAQREDLYKQADLIIDTSELSPLQVVEQIMSFVRKEVKQRA